MPDILLDILVRVKSGVNHGLSGTVRGYSLKHGGFLVEFPGDPIGMERRPYATPARANQRARAKRHYAFDRLTPLDPDGAYHLLMLMPESRRKDKLIAATVAHKLVPPASPYQRIDWDQEKTDKMAQMYSAVMRGDNS